MKLQKLVHLLQTHLQEEQGVQKRLRTILESQQQAAMTGNARDIEAASQKLEAELNGESQRERRRRSLMAEFGGELGVPSQLLTVGSLIERLDTRGIATSGLARVRTELRESVMGVRKLARSLRTLARGHGEVLNDVLRLLAGSDEQSSGTGILIDAEV